MTVHFHHQYHNNDDGDDSHGSGARMVRSWCLLAFALHPCY